MTLLSELRIQGEEWKREQICFTHKPILGIQEGKQEPAESSASACAASESLGHWAVAWTPLLLLFLLLPYCPGFWILQRMAFGGISLPWFLIPKIYLFLFQDILLRPWYLKCYTLDSECSPKSHV
jgi:hypothetical protein